VKFVGLHYKAVVVTAGCRCYSNTTCLCSFWCIWC